jgi:hypothetical protein
MAANYATPPPGQFINLTFFFKFLKIIFSLPSPLQRYIAPETNPTIASHNARVVKRLGRSKLNAIFFEENYFPLLLKTL